MSIAITPYLFFKGRCEEAIAFYNTALGAEVEMLMRFEQSPAPVPEGMLEPGFEKKVMHATVRIKGIQVMMSDGCDSKGKFEGFRLALSLPTEAEAKAAFDALAAGGKVEMPLTKTFWSPAYGMLTDRFGLEWMVMVPGPTPS
jgi:PhnB protein